MTPNLMEKPKAKMGRPTDYRPKFCEEILPLAAEGLSVEEICADLGFSVDSWYAWQEKFADFAEAVTRAEGLCKAWWIRYGREHMAESRDSRTNDKIWALNMMNRFKWNKKEDITSKGEQIGTVDVVIANIEASIQPVPTLLYEEPAALESGAGGAPAA